MRSDMRDRLKVIRDGDGGEDDGESCDGASRPIHIHGNGHTFVFARVVRADQLTISGQPDVDCVDPPPT
jgi:hypothetical protein